MKVLDGNWLGGREHRLKELRALSGAPLPGKSVAVFDPALELFTDLFPCEDAYTQERALLSAVVCSRLMRRPFALSLKSLKLSPLRQRASLPRANHMSSMKGSKRSQ